MKLYLNDTSPFAKFVLICIKEYDLEMPELIWVNPWSFDPNLIAHNPFSMVPALTLDDGSSLYESSIIVDYLTQGKYAPKTIKEYQIQAFGKQLLETTFRHVSLLRYAPNDAPAHPFIARSKAMIISGLQKMPNTDNISYKKPFELQFWCALDYIYFRLPDLANEYINSDTQRKLSTITTQDSFIVS